MDKIVDLKREIAQDAATKLRACESPEKSIELYFETVFQHAFTTGFTRGFKTSKEGRIKRIRELWNKGRIDPERGVHLNLSAGEIDELDQLIQMGAKE